MSPSSFVDPENLPLLEKFISPLVQSERVLRLLLVEDSRVDATLIQHLLEKTKSALFSTVWVTSLSSALDTLEQDEIDVILLDLNLIDSYDLDTFESISTRAPELPIVVLTGHDDREQGFEAIRHGAQDYLIKGHVKGELLVRSLVYAIERKRIELAERRQAELTLRESERKYQQLFEYESDAILVLDVETERFEEANLAAVRLFGFTKEEFRLLTMKSLAPNIDNSRIFFELGALNRFQSFELPAQHYRKRGNSFFFGETAIRSFQMGGRWKWIATIRDITERQKMQNALRKSEERFRLLVEYATDAFLLHDVEGHIVDVNQQACESLGYTREELLSFPICTINKQMNPTMLKELWEKLDSGRPLTMEGMHRRKDGTSFPVEIRMGRFHSEGNRLLLSLVRDVTQRKKEEAERLFEAYHDRLTLLPNRSFFFKKLESACDSNRLGLKHFAVLFLDLDRFKKINDSLGYDAGDQLIVKTVKRLKQLIRPQDTLARLSADEFALLYFIQDTSEVDTLVRRIREAMQAPFLLRQHEAFCTLGLGIALSFTGYEESIGLLRDAETALHQAKARGRAQCVVFDQAMREEAIRTHKMEVNLRRAIERDEFVLHYQPLVDLKTGQVCAFEALIRWHHPERGLLLPNEFLPVAEDFGWMDTLGWWVLREACRQAHEWNTTLNSTVPLSMSVNIASTQLERGELLMHVRDILQETCLLPTALKLEMTETTWIENSDTVMDVIRELRTTGIQFAMDDFGTGYSSLSYLHQFPVQTLKIDRSFISRMQPNDKNVKIVQTIVALAQNLGLSIVAEGVENEKQLELLRLLGCDFGQGYYFSPPVDAHAAEQLLRSGISW